MKNSLTIMAIVAALAVTACDKKTESPVVDTTPQPVTQVECAEVSQLDETVMWDIEQGVCEVVSVDGSAVEVTKNDVERIKATSVADDHKVNDSKQQQ